MACQDKAAMTKLRQLKAQAQLEAQNKSLVERFFKTIGSASVEEATAAVDATFHSDIVTHMASGDAQGIDQVKTAFRYDYLTWSDLRYSLESVLAESDIVVARGQFGGNQAGRIMGIAPTGKRITYPFIYVFRFENGKIKEWWGDFDSYFSMMTQLGLELRPKSEG
jgi:predicted ester cyclase